MADLKRLSVIYIAETKGKGGTYTFINSILREYRLKTSYPAKVELYTSPYIKHVRERIQINLEPILEECFIRYFFESWDKIALGDTLDPNDRPGYFRFLTLMSFDIFLKENITMAIYEIGVGRENNAMNIIETLVVIGITGLRIDHKRTLRVPRQIRPTYFALEVKDG